MRRGEREIELTNREFELLEFLMRNERLVISRERLLDEVWGYDPMAATNTIDVFISNLRRKLEAGERAAAAAHQTRRRLRAEGLGGARPRAKGPSRGGASSTPAAGRCAGAWPRSRPG